MNINAHLWMCADVYGRPGGGGRSQLGVTAVDVSVRGITPQLEGGKEGNKDGRKEVSKKEESLRRLSNIMDSQCLRRQLRS